MQLNNSIMKKINQLEEGRMLIGKRAEDKAKYIAEYEKSLTITMMRLKYGELFTIDNFKIGGDNLQANLIEKMAKGICWKEKMDAERAEGLYRAAVTGMSSLEAELNGLQSIMRYVKEI